MKSIAFELGVIMLIAYFTASIGATIIKAQRASHGHTLCERMR
jgi:hypothetical protein